MGSTDDDVIIKVLSDRLVGQEFSFRVRLNSYNYRSTSAGITIIETYIEMMLLQTRYYNDPKQHHVYFVKVNLLIIDD